VLINLVFNAMQAMPKGGRLSIQSDRAASSDGRPCLVVRVRDSGVGIAPALHQRIFEPFFTTRPDGTGLGLAICRRIVEGHGGTLWADSVPEAGSCFTIELPAA
jgi:signal transduction histidine kinase